MFTMLAASKMNGGRDRLHELSGTPPLSFTAKGKPLTAWSITGNTVQNGTPTPENPVEVQAVGDRTKNLFDKSSTVIYNAYFDASGSWLLSNDSKSIKIPCQPNTEYTISVPNSLTVFRVYESNNASIEPSSTSPPRTTEITRGTNISQYTFTTSSAAQIVLFQGSNGAATEWFNGLLLNTGSTALPYEPYGYKIPFITSAEDGSESITTPIYLSTPLYSGEVMRSDGTITRSDGTTETFTAPQIPTINGTTVIDVDTAVKPESMTIKYRR